MDLLTCPCSCLVVVRNAQSGHSHRAPGKWGDERPANVSACFPGSTEWLHLAPQQRLATGSTEAETLGAGKAEFPRHLPLTNVHLEKMHARSERVPTQLACGHNACWLPRQGPTQPRRMLQWTVDGPTAEVAVGKPICPPVPNRETAHRNWQPQTARRNAQGGSLRPYGVISSDHYQDENCHTYSNLERC